MTDKDSNRRHRHGHAARQRAIEAYDSAAAERAGRRHAERSAADRACRRAGRGRADRCTAPADQGRNRALAADRAAASRTAPSAASTRRAETGSERLSELGLNREKGEETIRSLFEGVTDAAKASGQAALDAARNQRGH